MKNKTNKLKTQNKIEEDIKKSSGVEIDKITDNLWFMIESLLKFVYGGEAANVIMWYVLLRDGEPEYWEENEEAYKIDNVKTLWRFVKKKLEEDA